MTKLPYSKLEKLLSIVSFTIICLAYFFLFIGISTNEDRSFMIGFLTFLYIFLLLFEYYPQTTNLVTSRKYNSSSEEDKRSMEHNIRLFVSALRCILSISHIFLL